MMYGLASRETPELMPLPITLAHRLAQRLAEIRKEGLVDYLRPDGKSQVTVEYNRGKPVAVRTVVIAAQHDDDVANDRLRDDMIEMIVKEVIPADLRETMPKIHVNPTGRFVIGGPHGDAGLTGRKIIVATYGGMGRHGGGAFSGKDPTKVDRSAAYAARWEAKNAVAAALAERFEIQLAYAIDVAEPVSVRVDTFGTGKFDEEAIERAVASVFDFRPLAIVEALNLRTAIYKPTAAYGHFGRHPEVQQDGQGLQLFPWELTNRVDELKQAAG